METLSHYIMNESPRPRKEGGDGSICSSSAPGTTGNQNQIDIISIHTSDFGVESAMQRTNKASGQAEIPGEEIRKLESFSFAP